MIGPVTQFLPPPAAPRHDAASRIDSPAPGRGARPWDVAVQVPRPNAVDQSRAEARRYPRAVGDDRGIADEGRARPLETDVAPQARGSGRAATDAGPSSAFLAQAIAQDSFPPFDRSAGMALLARHGAAQYARLQPDARLEPGLGVLWEIAPPPGRVPQGGRIDLTV